MKNFFDFPRVALNKFLLELGFRKPYLGNQLFDWCYKKYVFDFDEMTNLKIAERTSLKEILTTQIIVPSKIYKSLDGSFKALFTSQSSPEDIRFEAVLMPSKSRWTLCVSSQSGCAMKCKFCKTGSLGLIKNLKPSEILSQVFWAIEQLNQKKPNNIVFMGMGEPLQNFDNLVSSLQILTDPLGFGFSSNSITVSTVGLLNRAEEFLSLDLANLAISLNASNQAVRASLMPISVKFTFADILDFLKRVKLRKRKSIFLEYVMLRDVNSSDSNLKELTEALLPVKHKIKINLIPFNYFPGSLFAAPSEDIISRWQKVLMAKGFIATVRWSKARDIGGACGQLAGEFEKSPAKM